jgi:hypothetical protein
MKLKLNIEDMTEGFFENTRLIGIVAPVKDYQLVWQPASTFAATTSWRSS